MKRHRVDNSMREKITLAAIAGLISGAARAIFAKLLEHIPFD